MKEIKGIDEFLQISMHNNMPLSVNEKRKIFDLIIKEQQEIERLNNIINELERLVDDYAWNSYYIKCGNRYLKSEILNDIREIIEPKGSDKE